MEQRIYNLEEAIGGFDMTFEKYQHVEKFGHLEVQGIDVGKCYIFPKIDGTNGSVWTDHNNFIYAGSRNRPLSREDDNAGFFAYIQEHAGIKKFLGMGYLRLYGEWLVPHTIKDYRDDAWKKFYVFDVMNHMGQYLTPDEWIPLMQWAGVDYLPPLEVIVNPTENDLMRVMNNNSFLMKDGYIGEGIVIKNYDYVNRFGRVTWAKMVRNEFKDRHKSENKLQIIHRDNLESKIAEKYVTSVLVEKVVAHILNQNRTTDILNNPVESCWSSKYIPQLLSTVFYDLIREETWSFIKQFKNPVIDFRKLQQYTIHQIKQLRPELFL